MKRASPGPRTGEPVEPARFTRRSAVARAGVAIVLTAMVLGAGGCTWLDPLSEGPEYSIEVPGSGEFTTDETGEFRILYQSREYLETGVCHTERHARNPSGSGGLVTVCDSTSLLAAGQPELRASGGELVALRPSSRYSRSGGPVEVGVWQGELTSPGTYRLSFDAAPLGTDHLIVAFGVFGGGASSGLFLPIVVGVVLIIVLVGAVVVTLIVRTAGQRSKPSSSPPGITPR